MDWEYPEPGQQANDYQLLLVALRAYFPSPRYVVTTALPAAEWCLNRFDLRQIGTAVDLLNLMAYDFTGNWGSPIVSGHQGQCVSNPTNDARHQLTIPKLSYTTLTEVALAPQQFNMPWPMASLLLRSFLGVQAMAGRS